MSESALTGSEKTGHLYRNIRFLTENKQLELQLINFMSVITLLPSCLRNIVLFLKFYEFEYYFRYNDRN